MAKIVFCEFIEALFDVTRHDTFTPMELEVDLQLRFDIDSEVEDVGQYVEDHYASSDLVIYTGISSLLRFGVSVPVSIHYQPKNNEASIKVANKRIPFQWHAEHAIG